MTNSTGFRLGFEPVHNKSSIIKKNLVTLALGLAAIGCVGNFNPKLLASDAVVTGSVRIQLLSSSLVRLELKGAEGFEDRPTFHIVDRNWPGIPFTSNLVSGEVRVTTPNYVVHVPAAATSLTGIYLTSPNGQTNFTYGGSLNNSVWLPGPAEKPASWSFADSPRLIPPAWGLTPAPSGSPLAPTSGWDTNNDAPDIYVFVPNGSYKQLRSDFLKLTGPTGMIPLWALGCWDSRWYDYTESTALDQVAAYRSRLIPLDALVCDTGWRVNASTGYQPNTNFFPDMPRFFSEAHAANVRVMFNDHPEPVAPSALDPAEVTYRYTNLAQLLGQGLDVWWYDRNWGVSLNSPSPNLRHEVWGMRVYHDATDATNATLRPMIMANVDGIDNGIRNRPMNVAAHTYPIQWTGDIGPSSTYLQYAVQNAVHSGVQSLFPYESDDLGGHTSDPTPNGYIRWIEYGVLSPIYRPHCTYNLKRMPWAFGPEAEWTARRLINLRYRLLPVFYAAAHENYETGEPLLRRLDLDYPKYPNATLEDQYLIGHSLLVAPVTDDGSTTVASSWLTTTNGQPGLNAAYYSNTNLSGTPTLTRVDAGIDFNWNGGSPGGSVPAQNFTVRWTGNIAIPSGAGDVALAALSDDGVRVWVNDQLCIDNWGPNDSVTTTSTNILQAGQTYALRVEYLQLGGKDIVALKWLGLNPTRTVWIPPGTWINAWSGATVSGPVSLAVDAPLEQIPMFIRSGSIFALAPQMQYTGQLPWDPVTLDCFPSTTETDSTTLYEDDTLTTAYQQGQFRTTAIKTWADDAAKTVSVSIAPAVGTFTGALTQRSWVARLRRPPGWPADLAPASVTLNGSPIGPVVRRVQNATAMPLGADNGAPDADVFEVTVPAASVLASNILVASFGTTTNTWSCADIGAVGAGGNAVEGASTFSNSVCTVRGAGAGIGGTNDGFHFLYRPCVGNVQLTVQLTGQQSPDALAKSGIMISESLDPSARNAVVVVSPGGATLFQCRLTNGLAAQTTVAGTRPMPCWLRLVRSGNSFYGYTSTDNINWNVIGSTTISGFGAQAFVGLVATAAITNISPAGVDDTNSNTGIFGGLALASPVYISNLPDQITAQSTPTPAVPFTVGAGGGNTPALFASSSNTNLLAVQNIVFAGAGSSRSVTLTPNSGVTGSSTVTVTASNNLGSASAQFTLTVYPFTAQASSGNLLINEDFAGYPAGNLPGQPYLGTGFTNGVWLGVDSGFNTYVADAGVISQPGLVPPAGDDMGGKVTVKGDGSNLEGFPDLSAGGPFAAAGLRDPVSGTVGGGNVSGTLYLSFLFRAVSGNRSGEYGGLHLSRGTDTTGVLIGNGWNAIAYSLDYTSQANSEVDLKNNNGTGGYLVMDNNVHLLVAKIAYVPAASDTLTVWLDPVLNSDENNQNSASTYVGTLSGNLSFDRILLRGGNSNPFEYDAIRFGTNWASVLPPPAPVLPAPPEFAQAPFFSENIFGFTFVGDVGQRYSILSCTNLSPSNWQTIAAGTFGFDPVLFQASITDAQRFYRISIP